MQSASHVVRWMVLGVMIAAAPHCACGEDTKTAKADAESGHRVAAIYFHRTNRCATCKKISAYIEEAVAAGFAQELKSGQVSVSMIDFQDEKNKDFTAAYQITGPTLVVADVRDGKVTAWKPAPQVWVLVRDKEAFFKYVQDEMRGYLEAK